MKRLHVHVTVKDMDESIRFYNTLFNVEPDVTKDDYAKWMLDDPAVNFAISNRGESVGVNHLGLQFDSDEEVTRVQQRLDTANIDGQEEADAECCYAHSNKYWTIDTAGIPWENFHTMNSIRTYNGKDLAEQDHICGCQPMDKLQTTLQGCCQ